MLPTDLAEKLKVTAHNVRTNHINTEWSRFQTSIQKTLISAAERGETELKYNMAFPENVQRAHELFVQSGLTSKLHMDRPGSAAVTVSWGTKA